MSSEPRDHQRHPSEVRWGSSLSHGSPEGRPTRDPICSGGEGTLGSLSKARVSDTLVYQKQAQAGVGHPLQWRDSETGMVSGPARRL